jgi:transcriptional regulator with XRE-family HTH domain
MTIERVQNLSTLRRMRLWSQSDLAREAGVATSTISHIETGKAPRLRPSVMRKIAKALAIKDPMTVYELRIAILGSDSNESQTSGRAPGRPDDNC